jgi:hypothetical protein
MLKFNHKNDLVDESLFDNLPKFCGNGKQDLCHILTIRNKDFFY